MYGTVMTGRLRGSRADAELALADWLSERAPNVAGFVDAGLLFADDGETLVNYARFESRAAYERMADDPEQDRWYRERLAPLLDGEPTWVDGEWAPLGG